MQLSPRIGEEVLMTTSRIVLSVVSVLVCALVGTAAETEKPAMEPRIVDLPQMILVGMVQSAPSVAEIDIAGLWDRYLKNCQGIEAEVEGAGYELHVQTPAEPPMHLCLPMEMVHKVLPACKYAVFTHRVADGYASVYGRINRWLESSEYEEAHPYDFQLFDSRFTTMEDPESIQDIYVPIRRK
jgi:predicted transcriptional regulator YdeE